MFDVGWNGSHVNIQVPAIRTSEQLRGVPVVVTTRPAPALLRTHAPVRIHVADLFAARRALFMEEGIIGQNTHGLVARYRTRTPMELFCIWTETLWRGRRHLSPNRRGKRLAWPPYHGAHGSAYLARCALGCTWPILTSAIIGSRITSTASAPEPCVIRLVTNGCSAVI
jgi:hypothetical protein